MYSIYYQHLSSKSDQDVVVTWPTWYVVDTTTPLENISFVTWFVTWNDLQLPSYPQDNELSWSLDIGSQLETDISQNFDDEDLDLLSLPGFVWSDIDVDTDNEQNNPLTGFDILDQDIVTLVDWTKSLSWTLAYFWDITLTDTLWMQEKIVLVDVLYPNIYYVYMGTQDIDYWSLVAPLSWNIYKLKTQVEINQNELFWSDVQFINIPNVTFIQDPVIKRQIVFLSLRFNNDIWLMQIPYETYHERKSHIQNIFNTSY